MNKPTIKELVSNLAESILEDIDYDIYKEDLESRTILDGIESDLEWLIHKLKDYSVDDLLEY